MKNIKKGDIQNKWHLIDAKNKIVGRLSTEIACFLTGKNKPYYTPNLDTGDYVVVINAANVRFTGKKENKNQYTASVGRRKEAIARIRLYQGKGEFMVNGRPIAKYFPLETSRVKWQKPFVLTSTLGKYFAQIKVAGSGKSGQLDAVVHGLAR